jgi:putative (di)nucleoside polyphosphate hydrolase
MSGLALWHYGLSKMDYSSLPYRPCVGIMLFNREGRVWIGRRIPKWDGDGSQRMWQMPQGGIDEGETPIEAGMRELAEEIGTNDCEYLAEAPGWHDYDLPEQALGVVLGGEYKGQTQKWLAMRFLGDDSVINISGSDQHEQEFDRWRWADINEVTDLVVSFKRPIYERIVAEFQRFARPW